eukprot:scaffold96273_cov28-Tisochrysis_lutea.AAC.1
MGRSRKERTVTTECSSLPNGTAPNSTVWRTDALPNTSDGATAVVSTSTKRVQGRSTDRDPDVRMKQGTHTVECADQGSSLSASRKLTLFTDGSGRGISAERSSAATPVPASAEVPSFSSSTSPPLMESAPSSPPCSTMVAAS